MKFSVILLILYIIECLPTLPKSLRYRNINALAASFWCLIGAVAIDFTLNFFSVITYASEELIAFAALQTIVLVIVKLVSRNRDSYVKYGVPTKYTSGWRYNILSLFYDTKQKSSTLYTKNGTNQIGIAAFLCGVVLLSTIIYQAYTYPAIRNTLILPFYPIALYSFITEFVIFCMGESKWGMLVKRYKNRKKCKNPRELAKSRFASISDFSYIFMKNFVWEPLHIIRATKFKWKPDAFTSSIKYYDFDNKSKTEYSEKEYNPALENFIESNGMKPDNLYITAYNLIDREQNVLLKTPSYADFEPYLTAIVKMKVAKTQKIVLIVNNEEKKQLTKKKMCEAFNEYMGFDEIPVMLTIDECITRERQSHNDEKSEGGNKTLSHFDDLTNKGWVTVETGKNVPLKNPDIIIAAPEDICDPKYVEFLRTVIPKLGLIVYYDFSDCVQEEALFAKIVHSVLDYDDEISSLYMADSFFDLEQVVDNFFSKRNIYEIIVPRKPSRESYVMAWKAENINEMQSRTNPDASRDMGNHIPILYDAGTYTENDFILVEDEFDTYAENQLNFSKEGISNRFEYHVGWTNVIGGNSVMCTVSDTYNNVAHTYLAMSGVGEFSEYINIISRPYLLRNYLMYHLRFFTLYPGVLSSYSPGLIKTPKAVSYEAIVKLLVVGCTANQLMSYAEKADINCEQTAEEIIKALVRCAEYDGSDEIEITKDAYGRYYINESVYQRIIQNSGLVEKIYFITNRQVIVRNKRDFSCLTPQQKIVLNGVKYTVEKIIDENRVELTDSNTREPLYIMRPIRSCEIKVKQIEENKKYVQNNSNSSISFRRLISDVDINVYGSIVFKDSFHPFGDNAKYDYHSIDKKQSKTYKNINVFNIQIESRHINDTNCERVAHLFAILMNEMLPTFFPRHHKRIIVGCNGWNIGPELENQNITTLHTVAQMNIENIEHSNGKLNLYILEDSPVETGLVNVFWQDEEFRYMLKILEDYLFYQKIINRRERKEIFSAKYIKDLNLLKRTLLEVINETFEAYDENGNFISNFTNKIRVSRNKFNNLEIMDKFDITCDFCGKKIVTKPSQEKNYHFYAYSGMVSCMECFSRAVCTETYSQNDICGLEYIINKWFMKSYGEQVDSQYYNYLEDAERISELANSTTPMLDRYIATDDCEADGVLGLTPINAKYGDNIDVWTNAEQVAITAELEQSNETIDDIVRASYLVEDINRSYILIRNGLPYEQYMGVLAHEMTHQWQIANLDLDKMCTNTPGNAIDEFSKRIDLTMYRIEGHAEWERITYLKKNGHGRYARKEQKILQATRNAYGIGYIWMKNMMKLGHDDMRISANRTFSFIMKRNWYQFTKNSFALMRLYFGDIEISKEPEPATPVTDSPTNPTPHNDIPYTPKGNVSYYVYSQLKDEKSRLLYDTILNAISKHSTTVDLTELCEFIELKRTTEMIRSDHPELFWFPTSIMLSGNVVQLTYPVTKEEATVLQAEIDKEVKNYTSLLHSGMSEYDVTLCLFKALIKNVDYDSIALENQKSDSSNGVKGLDYLRTICGPFINKKAVCVGYAYALEYLLQKCGIECAEVAGYTFKTNDSEGEAHSWNLVKIDGDYYYLDATWDDNSNTNQEKKNASIDFDYFCITSKELFRSRNANLSSFVLPECTSTEANYFTRNSLVIDKYDIDKIVSFGKLEENQKERIIRFKCASEEVFKIAYEKISGDDFYTIGRKAFNDKNIRGHISHNDRIYTITMRYDS